MKVNLLFTSVGKGCDMMFTDSNISIEVKAMKSQTDAFHITANEFARMKIDQEKYFLIIVKNVYDLDSTKILVIQNPYKQLLLGNLGFIEAKIASNF